MLPVHRQPNKVDVSVSDAEDREWIGNSIPLPPFLHKEAMSLTDEQTSSSTGPDLVVAAGARRNRCPTVMGITYCVYTTSNALKMRIPESGFFSYWKIQRRLGLP